MDLRALARDSSIPEGLPAKRELEHASRRLTAIEINGTFYRSQGPKSFAKWRDETPENFVFTVKGHRAVVNAKKLAEAGEAVEWFFKSGISELGQKLGPVLWQFAPFKKFDAEDLGAFLALLPSELDGLRCPSCGRGAQQELCRAGVRRARARSTTSRSSTPIPTSIRRSPMSTADFVYARLQRSVSGRRDRLSAGDLDQWAARARTWAAGGVPEDLPRIEDDRWRQSDEAKRDVFVFFIAGAKVRAPAAAQALIERLKG